MNMQSFISISISLLVSWASGLFAAGSPDVWTGSTADWTNSSFWSLSAAPVSTNDVQINNTASSYTVSIDGGTPSSNLTVNSLVVGQSSTFTTRQTLFIANAASDFVISNATDIVGGSGVLTVSNSTVRMNANGIHIRMLGSMNLDNALLQILNPLANDSLELFTLNGDSRAETSVWVNSTIVITNAGNSGQLQVGTSGSQLTFLNVTNSLLMVRTLSVAGNGRVFIDNRGLSSTNTMGFTLNPQGSGQSVLTVVGGSYAPGGITLVGASIFTNQGANMSSANNISVGNAAAVGTSRYVLNGGTNIHTGNSVGNVYVGKTSGATGEVTVLSGLMQVQEVDLGLVGNSVGTFNLNGGLVTVTNLANGVSTNFSVGPVGKGYYQQTGGTLITEMLTLGTNAQEFTVGSSGLVQIVGAPGFSSTAPLSLSNSFKFDGTLAFAPRAGVLTQQLRLAGFDLGGSYTGYSNNFSIGNLDLSAYNSSDRLQLVSPFDIARTALYVGAISPIATNDLISSFNVYYDPAQNSGLYGGAPQGIYSLTGGGFLMPIPEPSGLLMAGAASILFYLIRRRVR